MLRRKVMESQRLGSYLLEEAARNEAIIAQLKSSTNPDFSFLTSSTSAKALNVSTTSFAQQPITTNTNFALSQLPALQALLADLRPRLASLQSSTTGIESVRAERREERREYIEQRAKLHLERHPEGALVHGSAVAGKRVQPEEVEGVDTLGNIFDAH
jgi:kinetochore protein Mis12/MTW1